MTAAFAMRMATTTVVRPRRRFWRFHQTQGSRMAQTTVAKAIPSVWRVRRGVAGQGVEPGTREKEAGPGSGEDYIHAAEHPGVVVGQGFEAEEEELVDEVVPGAPGLAPGVGAEGGENQGHLLGAHGGSLLGCCGVVDASDGPEKLILVGREAIDRLADGPLEVVAVVAEIVAGWAVGDDARGEEGRVGVEEGRFAEDAGVGGDLRGDAEGDDSGGLEELDSAATQGWEAESPEQGKEADEGQGDGEMSGMSRNGPGGDEDEDGGLPGP